MRAVPHRKSARGGTMPPASSRWRGGFEDQLSDTVSGQIDFWYAWAYYNQVVQLAAPETLASAELTLPKFQEVRQILSQENVGIYVQTSSSLTGHRATVRDAAEQYIAVQEALIKRGRRR